MYKRKKLLIVVAVLVMMLAMTVTAYAETSYTCTLHPTANKAKTAGLETKKTHYSGYNSSSSTDSMYIRIQMKMGGEWKKVGSDLLEVGEYGRSNSVSSSIANTYRTKIYTQDGNGGVEGVGCVFDW